jgi:hypothetical protein
MRLKTPNTKNPLLRTPKTIPISPNDLEYEPAKNEGNESGIDEPFFSERPSIATPYGRAMVNEEVEVIIIIKLGRKCAVGGWLLRLVLHFYWILFCMVSDLFMSFGLLRSRITQQ